MLLHGARDIDCGGASDWSDYGLLSFHRFSRVWHSVLGSWVPGGSHGLPCFSLFSLFSFFSFFSFFPFFAFFFTFGCLLFWLFGCPFFPLPSIHLNNVPTAVFRSKRQIRRPKQTEIDVRRRGNSNKRPEPPERRGFGAAYTQFRPGTC